MIAGTSSPLTLKRRRLRTVDPMEAELSKAKFAAIREKFGRDLRVFETSQASTSPTEVTNSEEPDDYYEFTAEDYYRVMSSRKEERFLKTRKLREAEEAARRARITKAVVRVRFPDNHTLEVTFHPSETIQSLVDLLKNLVTHPELPFNLYTTPPKKQLRDLSQDFYSAGFIPGVIVYFSYDLPKDEDSTVGNLSPFLLEEIMSLKGLEVINEQMEPAQSVAEPVTEAPPPVAQERKPTEKKPAKPKWLKM
ncbi:tether containing UBX domain for GLUT4 [Tripterygium wilfordii]|uniref:Tether containing UBX domain for GLUT4 n=1 Tax=Tripterygium wilfordii TaxID=458696 RepID=A0A7J7CF12_TRIWF|nr:plant UBX domain-containing protein 1-like [Tripterygium wilfordii]KAF5732680.1 tether containing UBX domain for GLUT4 [Tripterygium wilfordii]